MRTSSAKAKGRRLAAAAKALLLQYAPELQDADINVTSSGVTGPDLTFSPLAQERYPFRVECKNQESISIWACLEQAEGHGGCGTPVLIFSRNRSKTYVALELEELLRLLSGRIK